MTTITRLNTQTMNFGYRPDQRTSAISEALTEQRSALRGATHRFEVTACEANIADLERLLEQSKANDIARNELVARIDANRAAEKTREDERRLAEITEGLRRGYMASPGATEEAFQAALPALLEEHRRNAALSADEQHRAQVAAARASGRYSI